MEAKIFTNDIFIGTIHLRIGDYGMGGLYGIFTPNEYYLDKLQRKIHNFNEKPDKDLQLWNSFNFKIELKNGYILQPAGGIVIDDFEEMLGEPIQIELAGVDCDIIDKYFDI